MIEVKQPAAQAGVAEPDKGQLERWRSLADALLGMDHRNMHFPTIRDAALQLQNAYLSWRVTTEQPSQDAERLDFIESHPGWLRKGKRFWVCAPIFTNYEMDAFKTAREAIDAARAAQAQGGA